VLERLLSRLVEPAIDELARRYAVKGLGSHNQSAHCQNVVIGQIVDSCEGVVC